MTGLEKILSQIEQESNDRCRSIEAQAEEKVNALLAEAENEANAIRAENEALCKKQTENLAQSAASSAELTKSKILLGARLETIDATLQKALETLKALPDGEYFAALKTLLLKNAKEGEGVLRLSEKDGKRLPAGFLDEVNASLGGGKTVVLGEAAAIDSGFLLVYGDIDVNCSFDAIAAAKRDDLRDALNALLFA